MTYILYRYKNLNTYFLIISKVDFKYIFAKASFKDNLTIYMTVIVTMILYLSLLTWSLLQDIKDKVTLSNEKHITTLHLNKVKG